MFHVCTSPTQSIYGASQNAIHHVLDWSEEDVDEGEVDVWDDLDFLPGLLGQLLLLCFLLGLQPLLLILYLLLLCLFGYRFCLLFLRFFFCDSLLFLQSEVVVLPQNRR